MTRYFPMCTVDEAIELFIATASLMNEEEISDLQIAIVSLLKFLRQFLMKIQMIRKRQRSSWIIFLGIIVWLRSFEVRSRQAWTKRTAAQKDTRFSGNLLLRISEVDLSVYHAMRSKINAPIYAVNAFLTYSFHELVKNESNLYALQHQNLCADNDELHVFVGTCLLFFYHKLLDRRMYWSGDTDVHNELIALVIRHKKSIWWNREEHALCQQDVHWWRPFI